MIEVIYKEEKKEGRGNEGYFQLPKNIRQIGLLSEHYKIYMEDYVNTFLKKLSDQAANEAGAALLLGQVNFLDGVTYVFIRCALRIEEEMNRKHIPFTEKTWEHLDEKMKEYFPDQQVVGWFFTAPELSMNVEDVLYRVHLTHFGGRDKVLFLMESQEKEEAFFRYEDGQMHKQPGYYIYYEKNPMMQAYMIAQNDNKSMESQEDVQDTAVKNFRKIIFEKRGPEEEDSEEGHGSGWVSYAASVALAIVVFAVGSNFLGSYDKMQSAQEQIQQVSAQIRGMKKTEPETPVPVQEISPTPVPTLAPTAAPEVTEEPAQTPAPEDTSTDDASAAYIIQEGDTLNNISMEVYGTMDMVEEICERNGIVDEETIYPGQIIVLP